MDASRHSAAMPLLVFLLFGWSEANPATQLGEVHARLVIEVAVVDASGDPVADLRPADFESFQDGSPLELAMFEQVDVPSYILFIEECTGRPGLTHPNFYYGLPIWLDIENLPFHRAVVDIAGRLRNPEQFALARFDSERTLLRPWGEASETIEPDETEAGFGMDCEDDPSGASTARFSEKLGWITGRLGAVAGEKTVVWFGPPKNLPGVFRSADAPRLRTRGEPGEVPLEDEPQVQQVRNVIASTGASFFFVLTWNEFNATYPDDPQRRQRRYLALTNWADISGGALILLRNLDDVEGLRSQLSARGQTRYRLGFNPSESASDADVEVRLRDERDMTVHLLD